MIERRYRPGVAVLGGKIYVLGGEDTRVSTIVEILIILIQNFY